MKRRKEEEEGRENVGIGKERKGREGKERKEEGK